MPEERWRRPPGPLPLVVDVYRCPVCGFRAEWPRIEWHVLDAHPDWWHRRHCGGDDRQTQHNGTYGA